VLREHQGFAAHTNHYAAPAMAVYEGYHKAESRARLATAEEALSAGLASGADPMDLIERVLRSHDGEPDCICGHPDEAEPLGRRVMTVASMVCDLDAMELRACAGPPCENPYTTWSVGFG
jgi:isopenicillin-N N-acyltransferase-like protein